MDITFLGHSAFYLTQGEHRVLIDPFLSDNPSAPTSGDLAADRIAPTHIVLTHGHDDHLGDTVAIAKRTGCTVVAPFELANYIAEQGVGSVEPGAQGGTIKTPFGSVSFTHAIHASSTAGRYMGAACGVVVRMGEQRVYHAGDTALFSDMALIGEMHTPHVAIVPIGDRFTMDPPTASRAVDLVRPSVCAIPCHFNTWPPIEVDPGAFKPSACEARVLEPGETTSLKHQPR